MIELSSVNVLDLSWNLNFGAEHNAELDNNCAQLRCNLFIRCWLTMTILSFATDSSHFQTLQVFNRDVLGRRIHVGNRPLQRDKQVQRIQSSASGSLPTASAQPPLQEA